MVMKRANVERVNTDLVNDWIYKHGPNGIEKLALKSDLSVSTITKIRSGEIPPKADTRRKICRGLSVSEEVLFPPVAAGKDRAS